MQQEQRRLAAILAADVAGYSRLMAADESGTLARFNKLRAEVIEPKIAQFHGCIVGSAGDSLLVEFASAVSAVQCAVEVQAGLADQNANLPEDMRMAFRMGVNLGDVIPEGDTIHGDGVNIAARLEKLAEPGSVCIGRNVYEQVKSKFTYAFTDLGEQRFHNISEPVRAYRVKPFKSTAGTSPGPSTKAAPPLPDKPSIAVLPFANVSGDPEQEYFSDGISEDIIIELSRFRELFVIARNSSFAYKGRSVNVVDVGRELGVQYVVEGSVRKAGHRVRVTAQLIEAKTGNHLWAERYDRDLQDIFAVQDELTQAIVSTLPIQLQSAMIESMRVKMTENLNAYEYLLRGRWLWHQDSSNAAEALAMLECAVEIDPLCARAYAIISFIYAHTQFSLSTDFDEAPRRARLNATKALAIDDNDAFIHAAAALAYTLCGDHDSGEAHAKRALELNANENWVIYACGMVFTYLGQLDDAIKWLQRAVRSDPRVTNNWNESLVECHYMRREYAAALEVFRQWRNVPFHMYDIYAACYAQLGDIENAGRWAETYMRAKPDGFDIAKNREAHMRVMKHQADRDHWIEGFQKAGIIV